MSLITPEKFGRISTYRIADCNALDVIVTEARRIASTHSPPWAWPCALADSSDSIPQQQGERKIIAPHPWPNTSKNTFIVFLYKEYQ